MILDRRALLTAGGVGALGAVALFASGRNSPAEAANFPFKLSDADWRKKLSPQQYSVLRQAATERPFSSPLDHEKRRGTFVCAGCGLPLYASTTKFDSGTGWPSFFRPLPDAVATRRDIGLGMVRTEVLCRRCGGHLGHVLRRWPEADRPSLLHEWSGLEVRTGMKILTLLLPLAVAAPLAVAWMNPVAAATAIPAPKVDVPATAGLQTAILAGGCFWGMEGVYEHVKGVRNVVSGYAGGRAQDAVYEKVGTEKTGHAEAVRITYDPKQVSYGQLLRIYFSAAHDPTQLNRQGPDRGPSYRSAIFPQNEAQRKVADAYIAQLGASRAFDRPIVTRIESGGFYPAEAYHQDYMRRNPRSAYIVANDVPRVAALRQLFPASYR